MASMQKLNLASLLESEFCFWKCVIWLVTGKTCWKNHFTTCQDHAESPWQSRESNPGGLHPQLVTQEHRSDAALKGGHPGSIPRKCMLSSGCNNPENRKQHNPGSEMVSCLDR